MSKLVLTIKTDQPQAELHLWREGREMGQKIWLADRQLAAELYKEIESLLGRHQQTLTDLTGVVVFAGPGSFTGLRIGVTAANSLAYGLNIPVVGARGESWQSSGLKKLQSTKFIKSALPEYGALPNISRPKK